MYHCWIHYCLTFESLWSSNNRYFSSPSRPPRLFKYHVLSTATEFCLAFFLQLSSHSLKLPQFPHFTCYSSCLLCSFQCPTQTTGSLNMSHHSSVLALSLFSHHPQSCILLFSNHEFLWFFAFSIFYYGWNLSILGLWIHDKYMDYQIKLQK